VTDNRSLTTRKNKKGKTRVVESNEGICKISPGRIDYSMGKVKKIEK